MDNYGSVFAFMLLWRNRTLSFYSSDYYHLLQQLLHSNTLSKQADIFNPFILRLSTVQILLIQSYLGGCVGSGYRIRHRFVVAYSMVV
jgi:hypothetical protein